MCSSLRKQPTFGDATTGFTAKLRLRNERRNSILMTRHYQDLGSAFDWLNQISHVALPIRSTTQICVVTRHQYGISQAKQVRKGPLQRRKHFFVSLGAVLRHFNPVGRAFLSPAKSFAYSRKTLHESRKIGVEHARHIAQ